MKRDAFLTTTLEWHKADEKPNDYEICIVMLQNRKSGFIFTVINDWYPDYGFSEEYDTLAWASFDKLDERVCKALKESETLPEIPEIGEVLKDFFTTDVFEYIKKNN